MATARQIIERSARRIGMLANSEAMQADEFTNALQALNDCMHNFGPKGIQYAHTTLLETDTVNIPDELIRSLWIYFCKDLADEYSMPISLSLQGDILIALNELRAGFLVINPAVPDRALRRRRYGQFDFNSG